MTKSESRGDLAVLANEFYRNQQIPQQDTPGTDFHRKATQNMADMGGGSKASAAQYSRSAKELFLNAL